MAVLHQCFCYSLRQGSFIIGSYALIVYCISFAVELWWIVESNLVLPAPAYTLCALYFFNFIMAAVLIFGLLIRKRKYLMSWTLMTVLSFFPEAGMVLFMSLYYWPTHKYEYGVIELVFWSIRAMFNIFGAVCVCSLYLTWRDETFILGRLHDLTLAQVDVEQQSQHTGFTATTPKPYGGTLLSRRDFKHGHNGFHNFAYDNSVISNDLKNNYNNSLLIHSTLRYEKERVKVSVKVDFPSYCGAGSASLKIKMPEEDGFILRNKPQFPPRVKSGIGLGVGLSLDLNAYFPSPNHHPRKVEEGKKGKKKPGRLLSPLSSIARKWRSCLGLGVVTESEEDETGEGEDEEEEDSFSLVSVSDLESLGDYEEEVEGERNNGGSRTNLHHAPSNTNLRASLLRMKSEFNPATLFDPSYRKDRISELGIAGIGLEPPGPYPYLKYPPTLGQRSRSMWNIQNEEDFWARPPPSRPVSLGYINHLHHLDKEYLPDSLFQGQHQPRQIHNPLSLNLRSQSHTQLHRIGSHHAPTLYSNKRLSTSNSNLLKTEMLLMRGEEFRCQGRKAQSMDALNNAYNLSNTMMYRPKSGYFNSNNFAAFDWSRSSLDEEDDQSYTDIPL